jgi:hypothetical protein
MPAPARTTRTTVRENLGSILAKIHSLSTVVGSQDGDYDQASLTTNPRKSGVAHVPVFGVRLRLFASASWQNAFRMVSNACGLVGR